MPKESIVVEGKYKDNLKKPAQQSAKSVTTAFTNLSKAVKGFIALKAVQIIKDVTLSFAETGVKLAGIENAFKRLNDPGLLIQLQKATSNTVDNLTLMQKAVQAKNFRIPLDSLGKLLEFAKLRALETGESIDFLVNSIVTGLGRKSKPILDNLGISVIELNESIKKTGDFFKGTEAIIDKELTKMRKGFDSTLDSVAKARAEFNNLIQKLSKDFLPIALSVAEGVAKVTRAVRALSDAFSRENLGLFGDFVELITKTLNPLHLMGKGIDKLAESFEKSVAMNDFAAAVKQTRDELRELTVKLFDAGEIARAGDFEIMRRDLLAAFKELDQGIITSEDFREELLEIRELMKGVRTESEESALALEELREKMGADVKIPPRFRDMGPFLGGLQVVDFEPTIRGLDDVNKALEESSRKAGILGQITVPELNVGFTKIALSANEAGESIRENLIGNLKVDSIEAMTGAVQAFFGALGAGNNAFEAFGRSFLNAVGTMAVTLGQFFILVGTAMSSVKVLFGLSGGQAIAAGLALTAFGGTIAGVASTIGRKSPKEEEERTPRSVSSGRNVNINITVNALDVNEQSQRNIIEQLGAFFNQQAALDRV